MANVKLINQLLFVYGNYHFIAFYLFSFFVQKYFSQTENWKNKEKQGKFM